MGGSSLGGSGGSGRLGTGLPIESAEPCLRSLIISGCTLTIGVPTKETFSAATCGPGTGRRGTRGGVTFSCANAGAVIAVDAGVFSWTDGSRSPPTGFRRTLFRRANSR